MARLVLALYGYHYLLAIGSNSAVVDRLTLIFLAIASVAEMDGAWALVPARQGEPVSAWPLRAFGLQLSFLYVGAALWKLTFPAWRAGDALRENLYGSWGTSFGYAIASLPLSTHTWRALTWGVIALELMMGLLFLSRRTARLALLLAAAFHTAVWATLGIWEFFICLAVAPAALCPEYVGELSRRVRGHLVRA